MSVQYPVVGMHFRPPAKALMQVLHGGCPLVLRPEPSNPYDEHAIQVLVRSADIKEEQHETLTTLAAGAGFTLEAILAEELWHLGYIPRDRNQEVALKGQTSGELSFSLDGKPCI